MSTFTTAVACFLCKANIPFSLADRSKLVNHLEGEHMAFFGTDYLVAGCTMSGEERIAIQNVVKGRLPKLIQLDVAETGADSSETEDEGVVTVGESSPSIAALEPVTTIHEDTDIPMMKVSSVWSEAPGMSDGEGVSPPRISPPRGKKCPDCDFSCKLQIQMNRHKSVCPKDGAKTKLFSAKKWKLKIKPDSSSKKASSPAVVRRPDGSIKKLKKSPYVEPGKGHPCKDCGKEFRSEANMLRHHEDLHQPGEFPCPGDAKLCGKVFSSRNKMSSHYSRNCNPNNPSAVSVIARKRASLGA